jgi:acetyl coenzyme A synthetase (ADP forming)-like protein
VPAPHRLLTLAGLSSPPPHWEADVVLVDGGTVHVRPIRPEDAGRLRAFHAGLSPESIQFRFFSPHPELSADEVERFTTVDHHDRVALVAVLGDRLVAVGRYERTPGTDDAEVAFLVADEHQGRGLGALLLEHLAAAARECGLNHFHASVLPHNRRMLAVFHSAGFGESSRFDGGVVEVHLDIEPAEASQAVAEQREHRAEAASVARLLTPRSVAVVGAGRSPQSTGHVVLTNLLASGFQGPVHPVNPRAAEIAGLPAHPSLSAIPGPVDLVVIAVPAGAVADVVVEAAAKGVHAVVVLTAGFGEIGDRAAQDALRDLARGNGLRLVGPNCIGIVNTAIGLDATFAPYTPPPGRIAMQSQSGALGIALLERTARLGLGVSSFVSVGNKADVSGNDLLQYWEDDPNTDVVLLYLESFGNPRKFARIARRVSRRKPIVAVKSGRSAAGERAASSHTAAMASPDVAVDALFHQTGVIRVDTLDELFDMALVLSAQPLPGGPRVGIVGNSGGPMILATDACAGSGLEVPELSEPIQARLREQADPNASVRNPVDLVAGATPPDYEAALTTVLADDEVDAVIVVHTPTFAARSDDVAAVTARVAATTDKPVLGCFLAAPDLPSHLPVTKAEAPGAGIPVFGSPEPAARALARAARYARWRTTPPGAMPELAGCDVDAARAVVARHLTTEPGGGWLPPGDVTEVLAAVGVPVVRDREVGTADEAAAAATDLGYPVALKAAGAEIVHKSDIGGVALDLGSADEVLAAYRAMSDRIGGAMTGAQVQQMAAPGVETIVGVVQDHLFGPLVLFGMGGTATELLGDRSFRVLPVTDADAAELVRSLRSSPLLFGYRGAPPAATDQLEELVQRIGRLAAAVPEMAELDVNPVIVSPTGAIAVDARLLVRPVAPGPPPGLRRL